MTTKLQSIKPESSKEDSDIFPGKRNRIDFTGGLCAGRNGGEGSEVG